MDSLSDIVTIGDCTLYHADCMDVLPTLPKVDAVVTDPPYGIDANNQTLGAGKKEFFRGSDWDKEKPNISFILDMAVHWCIWGGNYFTDIIPPTNKILIWHKMNDGRSFSECEIAYTNFSKQCRIKQHHWSGEQKQHPTQKPIEVIEWCITQLPENAQTILDPFMGSGTTGVACVNIGRKFIGIEKERKYFDIACERIQRATNQGKLFAT